MVRFLINRPVAVSMVFLALLLLGLVTTSTLPVSLMPDIDIPVVTVRMAAPQLPAREMENTVVKSLRAVLKEVNHVEEMKSESHDGSAWIELRFRHGTPVDLASVEVNEKVDKAINYLPRDLDRPEVIRASASDLPVFYLMVTQKGEENSRQQQSPVGSEKGEGNSRQRQSPVSSGVEGEGNSRQRQSPVGSGVEGEGNSRQQQVLTAEASAKEVAGGSLSEDEGIASSRQGKDFLELSGFIGQVIRKRLEQLPEVALVDMSGLTYPEIRITPYPEYLESGILSVSMLETALRANNTEVGNLLIRDGQYTFGVRFNTRLRNLEDVQNTPLNLYGKIVTLGDVARVEMIPENPAGNVHLNNRQAVSLAIIKQASARMSALEKELHSLIGNFKNDYPDMEFTVTRDQTALLRYSISNLFQSLLIGGFLAFAVLFLFLKERRAPWLIGVSIPVSLVISLLIFFLANLSINIVSLSGLVLGVGMMVDNSIIVIDNITQYRRRGDSLDDSCIAGTNEVIRPLISSVLTTCAVFVPLIFMPGMAGALFFDQAMAITIGLGVSLLTGITLLPMLYRLIYKGTGKNQADMRHYGLGLDDDPWYFHIYEKGLKWVMRHQVTVWILILFSIVMIVLMWRNVPYSLFPEISQTETALAIDWNEPVTLEENNLRCAGMMNSLTSKPLWWVEESGKQQYLLNKGETAGTSQTRIFIKTESPNALSVLTESLSAYLRNRYPDADVLFSDSENLLNLAFGKEDPPLVARFTHPDPGNNAYFSQLTGMQKLLEQKYPGSVSSKLVCRNLVMVRTNPEKMLLYKISMAQLAAQINIAFNNNNVLTITDNNFMIPVNIGQSFRSVYDIITNLKILNSTGERIPLSGLVSVSNSTDLKTITANREGEYFGVSLNIPGPAVEKTMKEIKQMPEVKPQGAGLNVTFGGSAIAGKMMLKTLIVILLISLMLLYFILAAQFESFLIPLIVLVEIPLDMFGILLMLKLFGTGINIMSAIGIIVMSGIVINDSILKIDTINRMVMGGTPVVHALMVSGRRRLKPIIMTALTTILAISPFLFQGGMGAELERPLSLAIIGGISYGTLISLFFIPLVYYRLYIFLNKGHKKRTG